MKEGSSCGVGNTQVFWLWIEKPLESLDALEQDTGSEDEENICRMQYSWTQR